MMAASERFVRVYRQGTMTVMDIWVGYSDGSQLSLPSAGLLRRLDPAAGPGWQAGALCGGRRRFGTVKLPLPVLAQSGSARLRLKDPLGHGSCCKMVHFTAAPLFGSFYGILFW